MPGLGFVKAVGWFVLACWLGVTPGLANICDDAAHSAAKATGVPVDVMLTITRLETGRGGSSSEPWPWAVNHAGDGTWFKTEDAARSFVFSKVKRGVSNIDIGCFQINYRWHSEAFRSLDDMFNPDLNARHAADFLKRLYAEFGDWTLAAGAYHSRTPVYADRYKAKFREFRAKLSVPSRPPPVETPVSKPLFRANGVPRAGSLFVADASGVTPLIDLRGTN